MKLLKLNIILLLSLIYLSPDFIRLMNSSPFRGYFLTQNCSEVKENFSHKAKNTTFQRRRFLPLTKSLDIGKLVPAVLPNPIYIHRNDQFAGFLYDPDKYYLLAISISIHNNKAPPSN